MPLSPLFNLSSLPPHIKLILLIFYSSLSSYLLSNNSITMQLFLYYYIHSIYFLPYPLTLRLSIIVCHLAGYIIFIHDIENIYLLFMCWSRYSTLLMCCCYVVLYYANVLAAIILWTCTPFSATSTKFNVPAQTRGHHCACSAALGSPTCVAKFGGCVYCRGIPLCTDILRELRKI
jgi:hypothetical protein